MCSAFFMTAALASRRASHLSCGSPGSWFIHAVTTRPALMASALPLLLCYLRFPQVMSVASESIQKGLATAATVTIHTIFHSSCQKNAVLTLCCFEAIILCCTPDASVLLKRHDQPVLSAKLLFLLCVMDPETFVLHYQFLRGQLFFFSQYYGLNPRVLENEVITPALLILVLRQSFPELQRLASNS